MKPRDKAGFRPALRQEDKPLPAYGGGSRQYDALSPLYTARKAATGGSDHKDGPLRPAAHVWLVRRHGSRSSPARHRNERSELSDALVKENNGIKSLQNGHRVLGNIYKQERNDTPKNGTPWKQAAETSGYDKKTAFPG